MVPRILNCLLLLVLTLLSASLTVAADPSSTEIPKKAPARSVPSPSTAGYHLPNRPLAPVSCGMESLLIPDDPIPVQRLVNAALQLANVEFTRGIDWKRKIHTSALLPEIRFRGSYDADRDEMLDRYQDRPDRWRATTDRDHGIQISATWDLGRLVFDRDEMRVQDALDSIAKRREQIIAVVTDAFFERRRLSRMRLLRPPDDPIEALDLDTRIELLTSRIDALTGGLLSRNLSK